MSQAQQFIQEAYHEGELSGIVQDVLDNADTKTRLSLYDARLRVDEHDDTLMFATFSESTSIRKIDGFEITNVIASGRSMTIALRRKR